MVPLPESPIASRGVTDWPVIDWRDMHQASAAAIRILQDVVSRRGLLAELVARVPSTPELRNECWRDRGHQRMLIWDAPDKGYRIELRRAVQDRTTKPHGHAYPQATAVLHGTYAQTLFDISRPDRKRTGPPELHALSVRHERVGQVFALHHQALHATRVAAGTILAVLRGPVMADGAPARTRDHEDENDSPGAGSRATPAQLYDGFLRSLHEQSLI